MKLCTDSVDSGKFIVACGNSGAGKSTLVRGALFEFKESLNYLRTSTTRTRRPNEDEVEYEFVDIESYKRLAKESKTWDDTIIYGNHYGVDYGNYNSQLDAGLNYIVCTVPDLEIVESLKSTYGIYRTSTLLINVSHEVTKQRLKNERITGEMSRLAIEESFETPNSFDLIFTPTGDLDSTQQSFNKIIGDILHG